MAVNNDIQQLVQAIHDAPSRAVLVSAGAGAQALAWLLGVAGASRTLIEALVPYDAAAFDDYLGQRPEQYVAAATGALLAGRALTRGRWLRPGEPVVGIACTATIATDRPKRGEHRAHITTWQLERVIRHHLLLEKGARDRAGEEGLVSRVILNALAEEFGVAPRLAIALGPGDKHERQITDLLAAARQLARGESSCFGVSADGQLVSPSPLALLSGSFNPLHQGHLDLARVGAEMSGLPAAFELAAINADKAPLAVEVVLDRIAQLAGRWPVFVSNAPTFVAKARLFPTSAFIVGYDTAARILDPRYYQSYPGGLVAALAEIRANNCYFLVAGREDADNVFHTAAELQPPAPLADLFREIPADRFQADISSTELRNAGLRGSR
jgi:hypothetical protein